MPAGRRKEFDRQAALERAMEVFWENGFESTGLSELTTRMGIGRQSLYDTFGDKKSLYLEALSSYRDKRLRPALDLLVSPGPPLENLRQLIEMWAEGAKSSSCSGCMVVNGIAEFGSSDTAVRDRLRGELERLEKAIRACLEAAVSEGQLPARHDVRGHARSLLAVSQGLSLIGRLGVEPEIIDDISSGAIATISS